jgi:hypothetical protein
MKQSTSSTRDGFRLIKDRFALPKDTSGLDLKSTHAIKICDLFINEKLHVGDIVRLLHDDRGRVVQPARGGRHRGTQEETQERTRLRLSKLREAIQIGVSVGTPIDDGLRSEG